MEHDKSTLEERVSALEEALRHQVNINHAMRQLAQLQAATLARIVTELHSQRGSLAAILGEGPFDGPEAH